MADSRAENPQSENLGVRLRRDSRSFTYSGQGYDGEVFGSTFGPPGRDGTVNPPTKKRQTEYL